MAIALRIIEGITALGVVAFAVYFAYTFVSDYNRAQAQRCAVEKCSSE